MDGGGSYLPNNPAFLQQDPWRVAFSPLGCEEEEAQDQLDEGGTPVDLNINTFGFSAADMEPLTSLFSFSTCSSPYKEQSSFKNPDSNDVYVMKHALVHSNGTTIGSPTSTGQTILSGGQFSPIGTMAHNLYNQSFPRNISLESSLCSPNGTQGLSLGGQTVPASTVAYNSYPQIQVSSTGNAGGGGVFYAGDFSTSPTATQSAVFPTSMSVNLSMNMTMGVPNFADHFVGTATSSVPANHVQWTVPPAQYSTNGPATMVSGYGQPVQMQYNAQSPTQSSGTYTFTAEFRPADTTTLPLPSIERDFTNCPSTFKTSFYPCKHAAVAVPAESTTQSPLILKNKLRTIPTGRAACFPASNLVQPDSPIPSAHSIDDVTDSPVAIITDNDSNSSGKMNLCQICGKTYARPSTLKTHMRTHSGERPYRCGTCHKSFSQAANLTAHIRTHSGEKPFRCHVCDRRFSQSSSVTTHMRTHSGERPYRCYMCKKSFSDSSTLTKHLRIHSGEKPYQCKLCLLRFSQSGNLNRHMRVHAGSV
ncbi:protein glass-like [Parasteatoda tepidariorum]|uniref:protein glass-like n=1 Tax=Parasteatoda tepidariorum TaxID=114398 RepID=UPI00077FA3CF|nr:protein glass-like [Parasteatoda tepidariorum]